MSKRRTVARMHNRSTRAARRLRLTLRLVLVLRRKRYLGSLLHNGRVSGAHAIGDGRVDGLEPVGTCRSRV